MPLLPDFIATRAGAIVRAAALEEYRAQSARIVSLPQPLAIIGHSRLLGFAVIEARALQVH